MQESRPVERVVAAPNELGLESRGRFRQSAFLAMDQIHNGTGRLVVDFSTTRAIDSSGLNALILVQRRAAQRRIPVRLTGLSDDLQFLFVLTKLDGLFDMHTKETP